MKLSQNRITGLVGAFCGFLGGCLASWIGIGSNAASAITARPTSMSSKLETVASFNELHLDSGLDGSMIASGAQIIMLGKALERKSLGIFSPRSVMLSGESAAILLAHDFDKSEKGGWIRLRLADDDSTELRMSGIGQSQVVISISKDGEPVIAGFDNSGRLIWQLPTQSK